MDRANVDDTSMSAPPLRVLRMVPLSAAQALFQCGISVDLTLTGLVGYELAPTPALATLPFAAITLGAAVMSAPASWCVKKWGYRVAFRLGASAAAVGGALSAVAIWLHLFPLFAVGTLAVGIYQAFANYYRYAAADSVRAQDRSRAISAVLAGGTIAAIIGPLLAAAARDVFPTAYVGSYLLVSILALASTLVLVTWRGESPVTAQPEPDRTPAMTAAAPRRLADIVRRPAFLVGVGGTALGYLVMMELMTAAPLAAVEHDHTGVQGALIVQWHLLGMFAPAFFSGWIISRLGAMAVLCSGIALSAVGAVIDIVGTSEVNFMVALLAVGVGWNFLYVSGTTFIANSYDTHGRTRAQAGAELTTMTCSAIGAFSAGALLDAFGWAGLNRMVLVPLLICAILAFYYARARRGPATPAGSIGC
ncbi:MAG TPA: MFS transporter [Amycolatopsis sp.]|uniref:MFS transporter n=1 Tax=Amycolatopsis sp. TaxID=37632 RepID=UPI002B47B08F|nr:MFS transporter [Amycolatopsis sp.]HKS46427.1 MFS transporter [Amycolatopsis sp.]